MPSPRLLVIEGNAPDSIAQHVAAGGTPAHRGYSDLLRELMPGAAVDTAHPGDPDATLPKAMTASPSPDRRCMFTMAGRR
jgi:GMP synthase (glutamine-hydrolysing)